MLYKTAIKLKFVLYLVEERKEGHEQLEDSN